MSNNKILSILTLAVLSISVLTACKKNIPDVRLSLSNDAQFSVKIYQPVLGRNTLFTDNFSAGTSSIPLDFKIVNMRRFTGEPAPELTDYFPVQVWKTAYDGTEKSLAEIEAKRTIENHQLFEIREHSGQFVMWAKANSSFVKAQPDSGYVFDVEVSNSGGRRYFKDFRLRPFKERAFEPSTINAATGQSTALGITPTISNIRGERTGRFLSGQSDVIALFNKKSDTGNSLTFKFVDTLFNPIDPNKFNTTQWGGLVHGFDMVKDAEKVTYKVAYPIPLVAYPTPYTTGTGQQARSTFRYERQGFGNVKEVALLSLDYAIFEKGDWEITFWFRTERPKFTND
ncbi:DUF5007 domain-containing protein [Mucilaginibacter mali]|uniref:DUF5007 domain-containing protein n=1 Tax=Mucilaginibacter mali TaxID=2740462 RepID=A0A7D4QAU6_9SPHI|nr:DUF5007 domain-containing protein [Mucilaginibacter mali]QKJ31085.1 DUF5007 domain-containing protein [Mucilaginibacter mali]